MRKSQIILLGTTLFSLTATAQALAGESLSAAPPGVAASKTPQRQLKTIPQTTEQINAELKQIKAELKIKPNDGQLHFKAGEAYRKLGQKSEAANEYFKAINNDPTLWVAYHQLTANSDDAQQLDQAISMLSKLESEKPKELLMRVALSELYEKKGNYYQAARTLIDLSYANAVPEKWRPKVTARIHNMLALAKQAQQQSAAPTQQANQDEDLDLVPAPLPSTASKRSIAQAKLKDAKEVRGMGHTPLLP